MNLHFNRTNQLHCISYIIISMKKLKKTNTKKNKAATDTLAVMVQKGFEETATDIRGVKEEVKDLRGEMNERFNKVDERLDRIENILIRAHENRIGRLEDGLRVVKTRLKIA